jgi:hypothetical protein
MIDRARVFLQRFGIDPTAYGTPYIEQNLPMIAYARAENIPKNTERQIMDSYTIVFPIEIEEGTVYQEYGGTK